jgi:hypothetical protein
MSWNLLIYRPGATGKKTDPLGPMDVVKEKLNAAFLGLAWDSPPECGLKVEGGFLAELSVENNLVSDIYMSGGYNHLKPLASLCQREGWHLGDAQEGEDVDLDDPYGWYEGRSA